MQLTGTKKKVTFQIVIPILLLISFTRLFYCQIEFGFRSDIRSHIEFAISGTGYSYLYRVMGIIIHMAGESNQSIAIALFEGLMTMLTIYPMAGWMRKRYRIECWLSYLLATGMLFFSSIYVPGIQELFYRSGIVTQPWHNITYLGMRLFAVWTMYFFSDVLDTYQNRITVLDWMNITIPLAISTGIKPVFLLVFSWTLLAFLITDAIKGKLKWKVLIQCVKLGTTVLPALVIMYLQSKNLYGSNGQSGIAFSLLSTRYFSLGLVGSIIKILRGLLLAIIVLIYNAGNDHRKGMWFVYALYLMAMFQVIILQETGPRENDGNFYWIQYICGFVLYGQVIACWSENMKEIDWHVAKDRWYGIITTALTLAHFLSGIVYYVKININGDFFI